MALPYTRNRSPGGYLNKGELGATPVDKAEFENFDATLLAISQSLGASSGPAPYLFPSSYGVVGDGVTDDTVNMQAAFNAAAAAKKTLFLPPATYMVSSLNVPSAGNLFLQGTPGAILRHTTGASLPIVYYAQGSTNTSELQIRNIKFQGNGYDAQTTVTGAQTLSNQPLLVGSTAGFGTSGDKRFIVGNSFYSYTSLDATHFNGVTGTFAAGATVSQELQKAGVFVTGINDVRIEDCEFDGFMDGATLLYGCRRYWLRWNKMTNCTSSGGRNCVHVDVDFSASSDPTKMGDGLITGNYLDTGQTGGIIVTTNAGANTLRDRCVISNNEVRNYTNWAGIALEAGFIHSAAIVGNQVYGCSVGITLDKADSTFSGQETNNYKLVANNLVDSDGVSGGYGGKGIVAVGRGVAITGNTVKSVGQGIGVSNSATGLVAENVVVVGNTVIVSNTDNTLRSTGIFGNVTRNCVIANNTILRDTTGTGMGHGIFLQNGSHTQTLGNSIRQAGQEGIHLAAMTRTDVANNRIVDCNQLNLSASCIRVDGVSDRVRLFANSLVDTGTATPAAAALFVQGGSCTNISEEYNVYDGVPAPSTDNAAQLSTVRGNRLSTTKSFNSGTSTQTTTGATVTIAHGLGVAPAAGRFGVEPANAAAAALAGFSRTADATNITLTFPATFTSASYSWNWWAEASA